MRNTTAIGKRWAVLAILAMQTLFGSIHALAADATDTQSWSCDPQWVALTNDIQRAYDAFKLRYRAFWSSQSSLTPSFIHPYDDYKQLADAIDSLSVYYVDITKADETGSFETYLAQTNNWWIPYYTATGLHAAAGFDTWAGPDPLHLWMCVNHAIQTQVWACLELLQCTSRGASFYWHPTNGVNGKYAYVQEYQYQDLIDELQDDWDASARTNSYSSLSHYKAITWNDNWDYWEGWAQRDQYYVRAVNIWTGVSHSVDFYCYGVQKRGDTFSDHDQGVSTNPALWFMEGPTYSATVDSSGPVGGVNFTTMPSLSGGATNGSCGFIVHDYDLEAVVWWDFPSIPAPTVYANAEDVDTDRDDIVDPGLDLNGLGPLTGTAFHTADQDQPSLVVPVAASPAWVGALPIHALLTQGASTNLPYHHLLKRVSSHLAGNTIRQSPGYGDSDGPLQALTLNTRIIESAALWQKKQVAILRPRGNIVVFDFAWEGGGASNDFDSVGYPIGVNSNRTYVLRDRTPTNHDDLAYDLYFDSGIIHRFQSASYTTGKNGRLYAIADETGNEIALSIADGTDVYTAYAMSFPGGSIPSKTNALDGRFDVAISWSSGKPSGVTYKAKGAADTIVSTLSYAGDGAAITGIGKAGISGSDCSVSGNTITYGWGTVTRSGSGGDVTITTTLDAGGSLVEEYELNAAHRVTEHTVTANGDSATTTYEYYDSESGRYDNGTPKNAKLKKITYPDGSSVEFTYDADTGWLTQEEYPVGNGSDRFTTYAYSHAGDSTANATNLYERPRVVSQLYDATTIGTTYFAYNGPAETEIQECAVAGAAWDAAANLVTTNTYCTGGLTNGLLLASSTPLGASAFTYEITGLSGSDFTALGKLTAVSVHSTGQTVTNVVNAFGTREKAVTVDTDSGQTTASAVSTVDAFGRSTQTAFLDGTTESYSSWTLHGPEEITGIDGSVSTYEYYDNGRIKEIDRGDTGVLLEYQYDALGNLTVATATGDDATSGSSSASYDAQSRLVSRTDLLGTTTYGYANQSYGVETTVTYADGGVLTRQQYHDGSIKQISGTAAKAKRQYEYGIDGGLFYAKQIRPVGAATTEWTRKTFDALGNVAEIEHSGAGGEATTLSFDEKGRMDGWEDEEGVARVLTYTDRNEVQDAGLDFNGDGSLVAASRDRYLTSAYNVTASGRKYSGYVYPTADSANSNLLAEIEVALDGAQITSSYAGRTDTRVRGSYGSGGSFTVTNTLSDGTKLVQQYEAWRLKETKRYESGSGSPWETETLDYDGLGALVEVDNSRNGVTTLEYDSARRLATVTLPDPTKLPIEIKYWDGTDRIKSIRRPDGSFLRLDYYPNGLLKRRYDLGTYDVTYEYDDQGRCVKQTTDRDGTPVATEWIYDATSGLLDEKKIAGVTAETYTYRDNGQIATVTDANGVVATHAYNGAGDLTGITYSDGTTDPIAVAFNRRGQVEASGQGGVSNAFVYTLDGQMATNTVVGAGVVPDAQLAYTYGATHPGLESAVFTVNGAARSVTVGRNARELVTSLADGNVTAQYTYESGAPFVNAVTVKVDGVSVLTRSIGWDLVNDRMTNIACTVAGSNVASFAYTWQTNADRIARITLADGSYWTYDYDSRGHLTSGKRFFADGTPYFGLQYGAEFDSIGNTLEGGVLSGATPENSFTPNNLNVHVSRIWSNRVEILGRAATNATVTVNSAPTDRAGEWFRAIVTVDNATSAVETNVAITAVWFDPVASNDVVSSTTGTLCIAKASEGPSYDARASITNDSRYRLTYDAFGRLTEAINTAVSPNARETYTYFADGRRATKKTFWGSPGAWTNTFSHAFIHDRWNLIHERVTDEIQATTTTREYVWGLDLVGQRDGEIGQEAGGIGGLLAIREIAGGVTNVYLPIADHIGNIMHLVDADSGEVVANYLYSPFGVLAGEWGTAKDACPFRFQSKYYDKETGLCYFGYRFYDPASVKFITRDPKGEEGGFNLTAAFRCDPINKYDSLGTDYVSVEGGNVYWNVERDSYLYNPDVARYLIGTVSEGKVTFDEAFGGGSASLDVLKKYASRFWDRPVSGSVMDPTDISSMSADVQRGIVQDYLQHYVRDYGYAVLQENRGIFTSKRTRRLDQAQTGLDVAGIADPTPICDGINGLVYLVRGRPGEAVWSVVAIVPYVGDVIGKGGKYGTKTVKFVARAGDKGDDLIDVFRVVEKAEIDDIATSGRFRFLPHSSTPIPGLEGKWFYGSLDELDVGMKHIMKPGEAAGVVCTQVRRSDLLKHVYPGIDGNVTGFFVEMQDLIAPIQKVR